MISPGFARSISPGARSSQRSAFPEAIPKVSDARVRWIFRARSRLASAPMLAWAFSAKTASEVAALLRALGRHRYVRDVEHELHWTIDAALADVAPFAPEAAAYEAERRSDASLDPASYDDRNWRRASIDDVTAALTAFWSPEDDGKRARDRLRKLLDDLALPLAEHSPFEGDPESPSHPALIRLSWTLFAVCDLDPERHAGAIAAMEAAGEEVDPSAPIDHEGPELGPRELLDGAPRGVLVADFLVWADGPVSYSDYVFRGASKVAKLPDPPESPDDP